MSDPLVSFVVPVYNVEEFLVRAIESIVNQTYRNLEILLIDDGSMDGSSKICEEYAEKDSRVLVFHQLNQGVSVARNFGIFKSSGEYIRFVDSDDEIPLDSTKNMVYAAMQNTCEMVQGGFEIRKGNGNFFSQWIPQKKSICTGFDFLMQKLGKNLPAHWLPVLFKKSFLIEYNIIFMQGIHPGEDTLFISECLLKVPRIVLLNKMVYVYYLYLSDRNGATSSYVYPDNYEITIFNAKQILLSCKNEERNNVLLYFSRRIHLQVMNLIIHKNFFGIEETEKRLINIFQYPCYLEASKNFNIFIKTLKLLIPYAMGIYFILKLKVPVSLCLLWSQSYAIAFRLLKGKSRVRSIYGNTENKRTLV